MAKVTRGWQDEVVGDAEYMRQRSELAEELAAARPGLGFDEIRSAGAGSDAEEALLRHLADLKALASGTVDEAQVVEA